MISDDDIAAMSGDQRRALIARLAAAPPPAAIPRRRFGLRELHLGALIVCSVALVPWIVYLAVTVPESYTVDNWNTVWVGFDLLLLALFTTTAVLGLRRHRLAVLIGFATGVLLICDAGFDLLTSNDADLPRALASALLIELPLGALMIAESGRLFRAFLPH
ncbi:hypothetical protein KOI35_30945 [Actinoplanes bogorensis]|uniref:Uncharacterized protein n=1 Tax=Paractinoplanes bogorensis TaxID=1610840 RepID=A0ABS5YZ03_9ACTN|nr:hypothetical protein [Actinoplanes bogorensis]MBU2667938.1 hypothetical protein [Actinoplanes bogorensis]